VEDAFAFIILTLVALRTLHDDDELSFYAKSVVSEFIDMINPIREQGEQKDILLQWVAEWSRSLKTSKRPVQSWEDPDMWLNMERTRTLRTWPFGIDFPNLKEGSHHVCFLLSTGGFEYVGKRAQPSLKMITTEYGELALRVCLRLVLSKYFAVVYLTACANLYQLCPDYLLAPLQFIHTTLYKSTVP
jgi:hypothetical protein